jgi:hypothetical protein
LKREHLPDNYQPVVAFASDCHKKGETEMKSKIFAISILVIGAVLFSPAAAYCQDGSGGTLATKVSLQCTVTKSNLGNNPPYPIRITMAATNTARVAVPMNSQVFFAFAVNVDPNLPQEKTGHFKLSKTLAPGDSVTFYNVIENTPPYWHGDKCTAYYLK